MYSGVILVKQKYNLHLKTSVPGVWGEYIVGTRPGDEIWETGQPQSAIDLLGPQVYVVPEWRGKQHCVGHEGDHRGYEPGHFVQTHCWPTKHVQVKLKV